VSKALLVFGVCGALLFGGCGGGGESASTSAGTSEATPAAAQSEDKSATAPREEQKGKQDNKSPTAKPKSSQKQGNSSSSKQHHLVRVPPISSAPVAGSRRPAPGVKTVKGADNSVQEYGVEAGEPERRQAAIALQAYLNARAEEDWPKVCSLLASKAMEQLEKTQSGGCPKTMALLKESRAEAIEHATITEVLSLRGGGDLPGDPSYLVFTAPPSNTLYSMPMYLQGGAWKVGLALPSELPLG
jgi:hypothetical protein